MQYYLHINGQQQGPFEREQLPAHGLRPDTMVWTQGMPAWKPASQVPDLADLLQPAPPYQQAPYQQPQYPNQQPQPSVYVGGKSRIAAALLCIFLGEFGAHYFYCGKVGGGFICILLMIVTCGIWGVVLLVQFIMLLCMSDQDFYNKWVNSNSTFPLF